MRKTIFTGSPFGSPGIICGSGERTGVFIGIHFGFNVVKEHRIGIKGIQDALGVPDKLVPENFGLKMYTITEFPKDRFFFEKGETHTCLTFESGDEPLKGWKNEELENNPEQMAAAWDDKSFGVVVPNEYSHFLGELYEAFERKDILVQLNLDQTYVGISVPYLWVSILSRAKLGEEEKAFQAHKGIFEEMNVVDA